jgi:hypothetical protein
MPDSQDAADRDFEAGQLHRMAAVRRAQGGKAKYLWDNLF